MTENSAAHAVHVAGYLLAAMSHGGIVEVMNYHSFFEGPEFHTPPGADHKGAGYYSAFVNQSGVYISAVAQVFGLFSRWLRADGATMEPVPLPSDAARVPFDLSIISLFDRSIRNREISSAILRPMEARNFLSKVRRFVPLGKTTSST